MGIFSYLFRVNLAAVLVAAALTPSLAQTWFDLAGSAALNFTSGYHRGRADAALFHFTKVAEVSPWYDNPRDSWKNKYSNGDPAQGPAFWGSGGVFVMFTDDWHMDNFMRNQSKNLSATWMIWGTDRTARRPERAWYNDLRGTPTGKKPWWAYASEYAINFAADAAGFHYTYNVIYK